MAARAAREWRQVAGEVTGEAVPRTVSTPTIGAQGGVVGRPRIEPPADAAERIQKYASDGYLVVGIAHKLGVSANTFRQWLKEREDLREALEQGKAAEEHRLVSRMAQIGMQDKDLSAAAKACSYLLSTRHNYRDGGPGGSAREGSVQVVLQLPAAMSVEQYRTVREPIDHD